MNFKRKGPKSIRGGCLLCKPWKIMGNSNVGKKHQDIKSYAYYREELKYIKEILYNSPPGGWN
ncbi:hypothetical protein A3D77_02100 [Candidatus Gottesmanbacteria bacterium RIFCSPHIGHO2_02_FULL_39_11]|uniref:Uncharacterized protein n=1 Tax=Candidatus Gottesmanbacteria bacterium RIFCSPHIGHO2_02_FULL_39_11 TaxID=1798382 RepID=A0A1F5ZUM6_9BACT|nr:MAG: hypothetical protein A3D77_02100 [Candidatus Gottesmanbacteria bacterium RIFCSPHIGHO2_02_FULL_39_11]